MTATLPDIPTPREAWEYLNDRRGLRNATPRIHVSFKDVQMYVYVATQVPRRKVDGTRSMHKRVIVGTLERTLDSAIVTAALAVKHYMATTFEGADA